MTTTRRGWVVDFAANLVTLVWANSRARKQPRSPSARGFVVKSPGWAMATQIKAHCPECDEDITLTPSAVTLAVYEHGPRYNFRCPRCQEPCSKEATPEVVSLLASAGVYAKVTIPHPLVNGHPPQGPPICLDDLIDLMVAL